jgi:superfamily II DNA or RNA helicase
LIREDTYYKPKQYQIEAYNAMCEAIDSGLNPLLLMATGTGKTVVGSYLIDRDIRMQKRALWMVHRGLLLNQFDEKAYNQTGIYPEREQAKQFANWKSPVIGATVQTLRNERLYSIDKKSISRIYTDEAHRSAAQSYKAVYEYLSTATRIGLTATGDRADKVGLYPIYDTIAYRYSLARAIKEGACCRIIGKKVKEFEIDLSGLRIRRGDFLDDELGAVIEKFVIPIAHNIVKETTERKKILIFLPSVESARLMSEVLQSMGQSSGYVAGSRNDNNATFSLFHSGELRYLCGCQIPLEGYDERLIDAVAMCKPTGSRTVYSQGVGRGTRVAAGKENMLLLEFTFNSDNLKLVTPYELIGQDASERVILEAEKLNDNEEYVDFFDGLKDAANKFYDINNIVARATKKDYSFVAFDPLDVSDMLNVDLDNSTDVWFKGRQLKGGPTQKQTNFLSKFMIDTTKMDKAQASILIDKIIEKKYWAMDGYATPAQESALKTLYRDADFGPGLTKAAASMLMRIKKEDRCKTEIF